MRCAAASVTDKACFLTITRSPSANSIPPPAGYISWLCGCTPLPFQPVYGIGQDVGGEIDLGGRRETSEADANRRIRERVGETHRTQHIGGFYDRRGAGGSG